MSSNKKKLILSSISVNLGCSSCKKPKLSAIFNPKPRSKRHYHDLCRSSSTASSTTNPSAATTFSPTMDTPCWPDTASTTVRGFGRVGGQSVAVEKDSDDPYLDFRHSMLQMILENEIYSKDDLKELLNCFLQLNSPDHHGVIVRAFTEIWNGVFSVKSAGAWEKQHQQHRQQQYYYGYGFVSRDL